MAWWRRFGRAPSREGVVGLELGETGVALAHRVGPMEAPRIAAWAFRPCEAGAELGDLLASAVRDHGLAGTRCRVVLPPGRYGLRLVDAPDVEPEEVAAAAHWLVKDLIDFPLEEAVVDHFPLPAQPGRPSRMYVVTTREEVVREMAEATEAAGLALEVVDVAELALRNLAARLPEDGAGQALLRLGRRGGLLTMSQGGQLYLARGVETGSEALAAPAPFEGDALVLGSRGEEEAANEAFDLLVLEIQRSLDYYESSLGQPPIPHLAVAPLVEPVPGLLPYLEKHLSASVRSLDLGELLTPDAAAEAEGVDAHCLMAVGAALGPAGPEDGTP